MYAFGDGAVKTLYNVHVRLRKPCAPSPPRLQQRHGIFKSVAPGRRYCGHVLPTGAAAPGTGTGTWTPALARRCDDPQGA